MINVKKIYSVTFVIIGTIIGAGFASGQEIYIFFNKHGLIGLIGIFISAFLISHITYKTFKILMNNEIDNYEKFIEHILPKKLKSNKLLGYTISNIINIFLLISFSVMVAGFSTYFKQELNISKWIGAIIIAIFSFVTLLNSINGVIKINVYLIPIIILLIILLGINKIEYQGIVSIDNNRNIIYSILSSILYASYNSITLIPILISLKNKINKKIELKIIPILVAVTIIVLSVIIFLLINTFIEKINIIEIPIVYIANSLGTRFRFIYGIAVLMAIFTTAIGSLYGFLNNIKVRDKKYILSALCICVLSIFTGQISFSYLINFLYPLLGYLGIIQIIFLIINKTT